MKKKPIVRVRRIDPETAEITYPRWIGGRWIIWSQEVPIWMVQLVVQRAKQDLLARSVLETLKPNCN